MNRISIAVLLICLAGAVIRPLDAQPGSPMNAAISTACLQALGVDCTKDPQQLNLYQDIQRAIANKQVTPSQSGIVQQYLVPALRRNTGMQAGVVDRAYQYVGKPAGSAEESQWIGRYETWQTYERLIPMIPRAVAVTPAAPAAPQYTAQQQQQALQAAFQSIWGRVPTASEAAANSNPSVSPASLPGYVRSGLGNHPEEWPRIVAAVFPSVIGRQPTDFEKNGIVGVFGRYWTGADDLATYLRGVIASYRIPNYGPNGSPQLAVSAGSLGQTAPGASGNTLVILYNGTPLNGSHLLDSQGYLVASGGGNLVASGGGNFIDSRTGLLMGRNGSPLPIGYKLITNDGGTLVASGGGNLVASGGGNLVASGGGNLVASGGGNLIYDAASVAKVLANLQAVAQNAIANNPVRFNPNTIVNTNTTGVLPQGYGLKSIGSTAPAALNGVCANTQLTSAIHAVTGRAPSGSGNTGECDPSRYGAPATSYRDLVMKVGSALRWPRGTCSDPWITQATLDVRNALPTGSGTTGQCDPQNYNHGQWGGNYTVLVGAVKSYYGLR